MSETFDRIVPASRPARARRWSANWLLLSLLALAALPVGAQSAKKPAAAASDSGEFFIISSVNLAKRQLLVKQPTEVTEVIAVTDKTRYLDRNGKPIALSGLRAGDTVYVKFAPAAEARVALSIREGPMTVTELHRRYLRTSVAP